MVAGKDLLTEVVVDPKTGDELREIQLPAGYPKSLRPPRLVERRVSEAELALAAVVAGGTTEIARVAALHPLATLKSRAQARPGTGPLALIDADGNGIIEPREVKDLYAGLVPSVPRRPPRASASCFWGRVDGVPPIPCPAQPRPRRTTPRAKSRGGSSRPWRRRRSRWPCSRRRPRRRRRSWSARRPTCSRRAPRSGGAARRSPQRRPRRRPSARRWPTLFAAELPRSLLRIVGLAALDAAAPAGGGGVLDATERTVAVAVVAALLTTPLDVARTRVLLRTAPGAADAGPPALAATLAEVAAEALFLGAPSRTRAYRRSRASSSGVHPHAQFDAITSSTSAPGLDQMPAVAYGNWCSSSGHGDRVRVWLVLRLARPGRQVSTVASGA